MVHIWEFTILPALGEESSVEFLGLALHSRYIPFPKIAGPDLFPDSSCVPWYAMVATWANDGKCLYCWMVIRYKCPQSTNRELYAHWKGFLSKLLKNYWHNDLDLHNWNDLMCHSDSAIGLYILTIFVNYAYLWFMHVYAEDDEWPALIAAEDVSSSWCYSQSELLLSGEFVTRPACHDSGYQLWTTYPGWIQLTTLDGLKPPDKLLNYGRFPCQKWWYDQFQRLGGCKFETGMMIPNDYGRWF